MSETASPPDADPSGPDARASAGSGRARWLASLWALERHPWFRWSRRVLNLGVGLGLGFVLVFSAWPRSKMADESPQQEAHDKLVEIMREVSLSQTWRMYAPDPGRGHFYMVLEAEDAEGEVRELEDSYMAVHGWGTAWAWRRSRLDIWQHAVTRRIEKVNRNRTWYMRGVCLREARRGRPVERVSMGRIYRGVRPPEKVREGKAVLGKPRRRKGQDTSCHVKIIREMIATDPILNADANASLGGASEGGE